jgi:hypothetical protein
MITRPLRSLAVDIFVCGVSLFLLLPYSGVDVAISASSDNTTIVLAITIPLVLIACAFAACALSAQMKSKRQSNKVAQLSAELTQANVRSTADLAMLSKHMPSGKVRPIIIRWCIYHPLVHLSSVGASIIRWCIYHPLVHLSSVAASIIRCCIYHPLLHLSSVAASISVFGTVYPL